MKASIRELTGKYYSTEIAITLDDGQRAEVRISAHGSIPSRRHFEGKDVTQEQWVKNEQVNSVDWYGNPTMMPAREALEFNSSHFESEAAYRIACVIINAINQEEEKQLCAKISS